VEGGVELDESLTKRFGQVGGRGDEGGPVRLEQAEVDPTDHERKLQAGRRDDVAEGMWDALDEAMQPKTAEIVGHRTWRVTGELPAEQLGHLWTQVAVAEAQWEVTERTQRLQQGQHPRITQPQPSHTPAARADGLLDAIHQGCGHGETVAQTLGLQEALVDAAADLAEVRQRFEAFGALHIGRVIEGRLGADAAPFEILLEVGVLEADVERGRDPGGDDARTVAAVGWWRSTRQTRRKEQTDPIGTTQIQVLAQDGFEPTAAVDRLVEDLGQAHLHLPQTQSMPIPRGSIDLRQRPGQTLDPAIEERLNIARAKRVAHGLQARRVLAPAKAVVERLKGNAGLSQLLVRPMVAVQAQAHRVGQIGADLDKSRAPLGVLTYKYT